MQTLDELGISDNTVFIFTSDNGGLSYPKNPPTSNVPLREGKGSSYEGGVRVPLIVKWPGVVEPGTICDEPAFSADFYPTILEMLALQSEPGHTVDGVSIVPLLKQTGGINREAIYWHYPHYHPGGAKPYGAVRKGDFKLIEFYEDDHIELYNLREDIGEKNDLSQSMPDKATELRTMLHEWRESVNAQMPGPNPDYDPETAHLRDWQLKGKR
jgi:arylsulfatase A-like enzyme